MKKGNQNNNKKKWFFWLILTGLLAKVFSFFFKHRGDLKENFSDFIQEEEKEVKELKSHQESFKKFCCDSTSIFQDYFIPSHKNDHKPKILRPRSLATIAILMALLKVSVTGYLFFIYPNQARMTELITKQVLELTNQDRVAENLEPLSLNSALSASAKAKAEDMIANNYFAHYSPDGKKPWDWINRSDYAYIFVGENLAMNFTSASAVHKALMQSPSHKKNIMNEKYQDMGLALVSGEIDGKNTNVLVEFFGARNTVNLAAATPVATETEERTEVVTTPETETVNVLAAKEEVKPELVKPIVQEPLESKPASEEIKPVAASPTPITTTSMREENEVVPLTCGEATCSGPVSPNEELEDNPPLAVTYISPEDDQRLGIAAALVKASHYIYLGVLALMVLFLAINILVRVTVQHKPVIAQTLLVILFVGGLFSIHLHFLENIVDKIAIL